MPTTIEAAIPFAVVFFQNSSITIDGRLADAATANAHPKTNETFTPLNIMPRTMAIQPTTIADIFPALT